MGIHLANSASSNYEPGRFGYELPKHELPKHELEFPVSGNLARDRTGKERGTGHKRSDGQPLDDSRGLQ